MECGDKQVTGTVSVPLRGKGSRKSYSSEKYI